jgi:predicted RNase H-like HicB family nuclease
MERSTTVKIIVEKHPDGYIAYPLGLRGIVIAEGDSYEEALVGIRSAIRFHIETFGRDAFENNDIMETFIAEVAV